MEITIITALLAVAIWIMKRDNIYTREVIELYTLENEGLINEIKNKKWKHLNLDNNYYRDLSEKLKRWNIEEK